LLRPSLVAILPQWSRNEAEFMLNKAKVGVTLRDRSVLAPRELTTKKTSHHTTRSTRSLGFSFSFIFRSVAEQAAYRQGAIFSLDTLPSELLSDWQHHHLVSCRYLNPVTLLKDLGGSHTHPMDLTCTYDSRSTCRSRRSTPHNTPDRPPYHNHCTSETSPPPSPSRPPSQSPP
jgi:uncharacterized protein YcbK (DUF882 family)